MARGRRQFVGRGSKRLTDWTFGLQSTAATNVPAASKVLVASIASSVLLDIAPATIIRAHGVFHISTDAPTASEFQIGGIGIGFVNEVARALGVTAIPGPVTDALWDGWFVHQFLAQRSLSQTSVGFASSQFGRTYTIDSKAMRKFDSDVGLVFMAENTHASQAYSIVWFMRILVKAG